MHLNDKIFEVLIFANGSRLATNAKIIPRENYQPYGMYHWPCINGSCDHTSFTEGVGGTDPSTLLETGPHMTAARLQLMDYLTFLVLLLSNQTCSVCVGGRLLANLTMQQGEH